jgi:hypothetical protein
MSALSRRASTSLSWSLTPTRKNGKYAPYSFSTNREEANTIHHKVLESIYNHMQKIGIEATIKTESEVESDHVQGKDLIISIGKTYL